MIVITWQELRKLYKNSQNETNSVNIIWHVSGDLKTNEALNFNSKCEPNLAVKLYLGVTWRERGADSTSAVMKRQRRCDRIHMQLPRKY